MEQSKTPVKRKQATVSIDKDLIGWVIERKEAVKAPSINRFVNDVLRRLWAGSESVD
jgi:hypothetical protein